MADIRTRLEKRKLCSSDTEEDALSLGDDSDEDYKRKKGSSSNSKEMKMFEKMCMVTEKLADKLNVSNVGVATINAGSVNCNGESCSHGHHGHNAQGHMESQTHNIVHHQGHTAETFQANLSSKPCRPFGN